MRITTEEHLFAYLAYNGRFHWWRHWGGTILIRQKHVVDHYKIIQILRTEKKNTYREINNILRHVIRNETIWNSDFRSEISAGIPQTFVFLGSGEDDKKYIFAIVNWADLCKNVKGYFNGNNLNESGFCWYWW